MFRNFLSKLSSEPLEPASESGEKDFPETQYSINYGDESIHSIIELDSVSSSSRESKYTPSQAILFKAENPQIVHTLGTSFWCKDYETIQMKLQATNRHGKEVHISRFGCGYPLDGCTLEILACTYDGPEFKAYRDDHNASFQGDVCRTLVAQNNFFVTYYMNVRSYERLLVGFRGSRSISGYLSLIKPTGIFNNHYISEPTSIKLLDDEAVVRDKKFCVGAVSDFSFTIVEE